VSPHFSPPSSSWRAA